MAVLRVAVREPRVCVWFVKHRAARGQITATGGIGCSDVTWTWGGAAVQFGSERSATTAVWSYPTWEEIRKVIGPDCRALDWIHARYG